MAKRPPARRRAPKAAAARPKKKPTASPASSRAAPAKPRAEVVRFTKRAAAPAKTFPLEVDPARVEETLNKVRGELVHWAKKGRYTKVRFKFRGKQLLPDLPLAAVVAAEGLTFYWGGILRALLMNLGANAMFNVELVNDSEKRIAQGKEKLLHGDLDEALALFEEAATMDRDNPNVHLNLGIALKLRGDRPGARAALERVKTLDPHGPHGAEATKILSSIPGPAHTAVVTEQVHAPNVQGT
jgi:tetratricopeptide (TPR) repeat protein